MAGFHAALGCPGGAESSLPSYWESRSQGCNDVSKCWNFSSLIISIHPPGACPQAQMQEFALLLSAARRAASLAPKEKSATQRAKWFITRSERDCQTARDSPLDRDGLEDIPQATLEHLELGDHRKETAPQVEVRLLLSRNGVLRVMQREVLQPESCLALFQVLHHL